MNVQCTSKLQRFNLSLIFTLTIAITAPSVFAKKFDATIDILALRSNAQLASSKIPQSRHSHWGSLGTHDSGALPTPAPPVLIAKANVKRQRADSPPTVVVNQVVEPFITVGAFTPNSLKSIQTMDAWQISLATIDNSRSTAHLTPLDLQLQELAAEEPIDIETLGPSVLIPENRPMSVTRIEVAPISPLIGSSPVIATIEEDYMPYDLSAQDLQNWNAYPIESHPFSSETDVSDEQTAGLWDDFDTAMALSKCSDPVELDALARAKLDPERSSAKSPSSPSDLALAPNTVTDTDKYNASQHDANVESIPVPNQPDSATTSDEALAILTRPESLLLSPAPQHTSDPTTAQNAATVEKKTSSKMAGPADLALQAIIQNLSDLKAFEAASNASEISTVAGSLFGSYTGHVNQWVSKRIADIAINWPARAQSNQASRIGAKLLSRASVLESGVIEENTIGVYVPIERLDGVDCGREASMKVADANAETKTR